MLNRVNKFCIEILKHTYFAKKIFPVQRWNRKEYCSNLWIIFDYICECEHVSALCVVAPLICPWFIIVIIGWINSLRFKEMYHYTWANLLAPHLLSPSLKIIHTLQMIIKNVAFWYSKNEIIVWSQING